MMIAPTAITGTGKGRVGGGATGKNSPKGQFPSAMPLLLLARRIIGGLVAPRKGADELE